MIPEDRIARLLAEWESTRYDNTFVTQRAAVISQTNRHTEMIAKSGKKFEDVKLKPRGTMPLRIRS